MDHDLSNDRMSKPPLRDFKVCTVDGQEHVVTAHLVFNNKDRGEGLVFRRYYEDNVRTEKVAEFLDWVWYKEVPSGD